MHCTKQFDILLGRREESRLYSALCPTSQARLGKKVIILDADFGLANIEVMLGIRPEFNLADLMFKPEVEDELVDIYAITHIKIIDVIGDGSQFDTMGDPIYDPYPTSGSAGFDLDAVAVINEKE